MGQLLTLMNRAEAEDYYARGLWRPDTMFSLLEKWAIERSDAIAVRDPWGSVTWRQLLTQVEAVATELAAAGMKAGDRVSVMMGNRVEAVIVFLAASRNGYVYNTSIHQTYTIREACDLIRRVGSRACFIQPGYGADADRHDIFAELAGDIAPDAMFAVPLAGEAPVDGVREFPRDRPNADLPPKSADPDKIVYLAFTSGTTGKPKGVMHSDNTLLANARSMVADWKYDRDTVLLTLSQMSHHIGTVALDQALVGGFTLVLSDTRKEPDLIDWICRTGATYVMGVPTHAIDILAEMDRRKLERLGRVAVFYLAGAPIPKEVARRFLAMGTVPQNVYGMTENGSHQYTLPDDDVVTITESCGRSCDAYEIALFDEADRNVPVPMGQIGEIGGRGAMRMLGYFGDQEATEGSFNADGWFMSGDLGRLDSSGNLEVVGRVKDVIIRGGHNIYPAQIEDVAMRYAGVGKVAAVPVADERLGERVCLIICADSDVKICGHGLLAFLRDQGISKYDLPEFFLQLDLLPIGPTGKVLKKELCRMLTAGEIVVSPVREGIVE